MIYYDRAGKSMESSLAWAKLFEDDVYRNVAVDRVGQALVSTVWVGINVNALPGGAPVIFETMIFGGPHDQERFVYCTEDQARVGHMELVEALLDEREKV